MEAVENVVCTACPRHCIIGVLGVTGIPKDSEELILTANGNDIREMCIANYIEPENPA